MADMKQKSDWDPRSEEVLDHPLTAFDEMRSKCPVAHSEYMGWSVFRHEDVLKVVEDHETFSNQVSRHRSVPNGMDRPEHTPYRNLIEPFFSQARMARFEPLCRKISADLVQEVIDRQEVDIAPSWPRTLRCRSSVPFSDGPTACKSRFDSGPMKTVKQRWPVTAKP